jgi:hypothetical protein
MAEVTDSTGRKFITRELDPADMLDLFEAAGDASGNQAWIRMAMIVHSVMEIDGVPLPIAVTKDDIRANARRIKNEGLVALSKHMFGDNAKKADGDAVKTAKN